MTVSARIGCAIALLVLIGAAGSVAYGQPATRPSSKDHSPPGPDPETKAKLDEQAAALAKTSADLAAQQRTIDELVAREAALAKALEDGRKAEGELGKALEASRRIQDALATRLDAEHGERLTAIEQLATAASVHSAWPTVTLSGFLQVDAAIRQASDDQLRQSGDPLNQDRFSLRRARPRITAAYGHVGGIVEIDINTVNGGQVRPSAVEATYQPAAWLRAGMGIAKIPFGFEVEQSDRERLFLERSNAERALFPGEYDLGVKLSGAWKFLRYAVAAQNGEPIGEKAFTLRDPNRAKDISARVGVETHAGDATVAAGFSFLTGRGFHAGTPATKDVLVWRDLNEDGVVNTGEIQVVAGQAATPSASFDRFGVGADVEVAIDLHTSGKLMVYGEVVAAGNLDRANVIADPIATGRDARELGWYLAGVYEPTKLWAFGARFDVYDPDADASELRTGTVVPLDQKLSTLSATAAVRGEHGRLILQFDHNTNHLGRTMSGVPTNLGDDAVTLRAEVQL
ncbi:MAG: phosphate-selective porin [Myxococcales bacterium]|nr:phosphate-selective porin [Myxococcales bacterium]